MPLLKPISHKHGVNFWDNEHCDLLLHKDGPSEDDGMVAYELYFTVGDTFCLTVDEDGEHVHIEQLSLKQAIAKMKRRYKSKQWYIPMDCTPLPHIIRLFELPAEWMIGVEDD